MFATWIPEALQKIEELATLPHPPGFFAVSCARKEIVNLPNDYSRPLIDTWDSPDGLGILIKWDTHSVRICPSGGLIETV